MKEALPLSELLMLTSLSQSKVQSLSPISPPHPTAIFIHFQMAITLVQNEIFQKFKTPVPSAWCALALEKEYRSIGPLGPELWPCKDGNHQKLFQI